MGFCHSTCSVRQPVAGQRILLAGEPFDESPLLVDLGDHVVRGLDHREGLREP